MSRFLTIISRYLEDKCRAAMLHNRMDLFRLMVRIKQVEDNRRKRGSMSLGGLNLLIRKVLVMVAAGATSASGSSADLKKGIRVQGTLTLRGVQNLDEADSSLRKAMEVMYSIPERNVTSVAILIVESADMALMPTSVAGRAGHMVKDCP